jgi:hypothetical protein
MSILLGSYQFSHPYKIGETLVAVLIPMFLIDWQIGYIIYMSEGLVCVIAMQIGIEQIYSRHGVRFNTLNIGGLFCM